MPRLSIERRGLAAPGHPRERIVRIFDGNAVLIGRKSRRETFFIASDSRCRKIAPIGRVVGALPRHLLVHSLAWPVIFLSFTISHALRYRRNNPYKGLDDHERRKRHYDYQVARHSRRRTRIVARRNRDDAVRSYMRRVLAGDGWGRAQTGAAFPRLERPARAADTESEATRSMRY